MTSPLLEVRDLVVDFHHRGKKHGGVTHAVQNVSLTISEGQTYGLVGESGSGKSTLARAALGLIPATSGSTLLAGTAISTSRGRDMRALRRDISIVFQNPVAALNPRLNVRALIAEPLKLHGVTRQEVDILVAELLDQVGLAAAYADRLPHELSGGQCQRVGIARALTTRPKLLVLDEPTSALDVSVQAQILNLLLDLKNDQGLTYLLISHDLDVIAHMSDKIGVMYRGRIVEENFAGSLLASPVHPYTTQLLTAIPGHGRELMLQGNEDTYGSAVVKAAVTGCAFLERCPIFRSERREDCMKVIPELRHIGDGQIVACNAATAVAREQTGTQP